MNKTILLGRLVRDNELKTLASSGSAVLNNSIAVSRYHTDNNGEKREETLFIDVVFFNRLAEVVNQYLKKGSKVLVEGYLQQQTWVDNATNQNRSKIQLVVESMEMLDNKPADNQNNGYQGNNYQQQNTNNQPNTNYQANNYQTNNGHQQDSNSQQNYQIQNNYQQGNNQANNYQQNSYEDVPF
ncbi:single-stranded DNA-binding protein [Campylobacter sp. MG1]|uniref:single-stranded DNA-binding protein n=1 Tax=Campylobacter sp. MG1 TaxID=2976332 RepID=UPI00226C8919|nr:single-stranded DNA-binding protein [Campylobacter sp. MG1]